MIILLLAFLIGAVAGLRAFTAPTAVSWAAHLGWVSLGGGPLAFLGFAWTPWILTLLALVAQRANHRTDNPRDPADDQPADRRTDCCPGEYARHDASAEPAGRLTARGGGQLVDNQPRPS